MSNFLMENPYFFILITIGTFLLGRFIQRKTKISFFNPIVISAVLIILMLVLLKIPYENYQEGLEPLQYLLTPATICFAIGMYENIAKLKKHLIAIILGVLAGSLTSLASIRLMCYLFGFDASLTNSLLPKSITTAIAIPLTDQAAGIVSIAAASVILSGLLGNIFGPLLMKLFKFDDPITAGVAIGTSSHAIGTSKAKEIGELYGAVSSLALTFAGLITVILFSFFTL